VRARKIIACLLSVLLIAVLAACTDDPPDASTDEPGDSASGAIPGVPTDTPEAEADPLIYIALGDSVPAGYGVRSLDEMHTHIFYEILENEQYANEYINMAVNGLTTSALLSLLSSSDESDLLNFMNASVITLNIGGNNFLLTFSKYIPDADEMNRIITEAMDFVCEAEALLHDIISFVEESQDTITEVSDIASEIMEITDSPSFSDIFRLSGIIQRASAVLGDTIEVLDAVSGFEKAVVDILDRAAELELLSAISLMLGTFPPELEAELERELRGFSDDFAEIISWLEDHAPNALIIVNTVYNPIPAQLFGMPLNLSNRANTLIQSMNETIYNESSGGRYVVSDIYSILSNQLDFMNVSFDIIHPNSIGHSLIAQLNYVDFLHHMESAME